jgi:hypothetical protein
LRIEFQKCGLINLPPLRPMLHSQSEKEPSREHAVASVAPATSFNRRSQQITRSWCWRSSTTAFEIIANP